MGLGIKLCDDPAGGLFEEAWHKRMNQGRACRCKQQTRKFQRKGHMLQKCFVDLGGMFKKDA